MNLVPTSLWSTIMLRLGKLPWRSIFVWAAVILLILFLQYKACKSPLFSDQIPRIDTVVQHDTVWHTKDSIVYRTPKHTGTLPPDNIPQSYQPSEDCSDLKLQYSNLVNEHFSKEVYFDSLKIDSSWVLVNDTVSANKIVGRSYKFHIKYPEITNTVTITKTNQPKRQVYIGFEYTGSNSKIFNAAGLGLLYKDRKDRIVGIQAGYSYTGTIYYGVQSYWKIRLRK